MLRSLIQRLFVAGLVCGSALAMAGAATSDTLPQTRQTTTASSSSAKIRLIAEVTAVEKATRTLLLKRDNGNIVTVVASSRLKHFDQVKPGDFLIVEYYRAKAVAIRKSNAPRVLAEADDDPAKPIAQPVAGKPGVFSILADIIAINDRKGYATLKGLHNNVVDAQFKNRKILASVKIGDQVELQYSDSVAVSIRKAETRR